MAQKKTKQRHQKSRRGAISPTYPNVGSDLTTQEGQREWAEKVRETYNEWFNANPGGESQQKSQ